MADSGAAPRVGFIGGSPELAVLCATLGEISRLELVPRGRPIELDTSVDVVLFELSAARPLEDQVVELREITAAPLVCLVPEATPAFIARALDNGIADVLMPPYDSGTILFALEKALRIRNREQAEDASGTVIAVFSPKGGTGKSAVASNLATSLARRRRRRTLLVDLDLQFGDAAIMLGSVPTRTIAELARSSAPVDAEELGVYVERHTSSLDILAAPLLPEEAELIDGDAVRAVLELVQSVYDVVVIDTAPFFDQQALASIDVTDYLLVVCTPDIPTVKNVRLALATLEMLSFPDEKLRVVLNRSGEAGGLSVDEVTRGLGRAVDVVLPFDVLVPQGINRGVPAVLASERAPFAKALATFGRELVGESNSQLSPLASRVAQPRFFSLAWR